MISGHVFRVMRGGSHRGWIWKLAGLFCCLAGIVAIVAKMTHVAMSRGVPIAEPYDFFSMVTNGDFAIAMSGGYVFLLGIMLLYGRSARHAPAPRHHSQTAAWLTSVDVVCTA
jgi:hypothetical protein